MTPRQMLDNIRRKTFDQILDEVLEETMSFLLDANTEQLRKGKLNDGDSLERYRSAAYLDYKQRVLGTYRAEGGAADLFVEGDFYHGFKGVVKSLYIEVYSTDWKAEKLEKKYSSDIYGLSQESIAIVKQQILPELQKRLRNAIGI